MLVQQIPHLINYYIKTEFFTLKVAPVCKVYPKNFLQINPDIREAHMLKGWFDNGGNVAETVNLSGKSPLTGGGKYDNGRCFICVQTVLDLQTFGDADRKTWVKIFFIAP